MRVRSGLLATVVAGLLFAGIALAAQDPPTPVITGTPRVGETLTASGATIFKWQRCNPVSDPCAADASQNASGWEHVSGQESDPSAYTLTLADAGMMIRVLGKDTVEGSKFGPSNRVGPIDPPPGSILVTKDLAPGDDDGVFDLMVEDQVVAEDASDGGSGIRSGLSPGTYTVSELAGTTGTSLSDYDSSIECTGEGGAQSGTSLDVTVAGGESVQCTITNTRPGSITVTKDLAPDDDDGVFDLMVDGQVVAENASDGGSGIRSGLSPGTHTVSEDPGAGTTGLSDYDSSIECTGEGGAQSGTSLDVTVAAGESVQCTITNTRPPVAPPPPPGDLRALFQRSGILQPLEGTILFKLPGSNQFVELQEVTEVPMGTKVDVSDGHALLVTQKKPSGELQSIELWAGAFSLQQKRKNNITVLTLANSFANTVQSRAGDETTSLRGKKKRRLWGRGKCRCRHRGRNSSGTSRGTWWLTAERPKGTLTKVKKGKVKVRDFKRRKKVLVKAGEKYLARR